MTYSISTADNLLLRAWRRGELDSTAADALEARLFFEPNLLEAAQLDQQIDPGLNDAHVAAPQPRRGSAPARRSTGPWSMLLAAGVGAMAVLPFVGTSEQAPATRGNVEWVSLDVRRSASDEALLVAPRADVGMLVMELPAPAAGNGPFTLSLVAAPGGERPVQIAGLLPKDGVLSLAFAPGELAAGDYLIEIASTDGAAAGAALRIRYRPQALD